MHTRRWRDRAFDGRRFSESGMDALGRPTILLVEDEPDILELLVLLFEQAGFTCVPSRTADEALDYLRNETFDLVLADYSLPSRSAAWMLEQAGEEGLLTATPVLVVTAHPDPRGVDGFEIIRKPFDLDQLVDRVKQRLEGGAPRPRAPRRGRAASRPYRLGNHDGSGNGREPIDLVLYISTYSPRSFTAIENLRRALARYQPSRVRLTICDLASDPSSGVADAVTFTPTLVKRSPGPRTFILGHLSNPDLLLELLDGC
jgi:DNA-binding response OmpR family regulator